MHFILFLLFNLSDGIPEQHPIDPIKVEEVEGYLTYPPCNSVQCSLQLASSIYNVPLSRLTCLALRESTFNPFAQNGPYLGLMQFDAPTWRLTPYSHRPRTDHEASALAAAYLISQGQSSRWPIWNRGC